jgi:murein DD-endopeptidase MepM/ murein hydrolase activator NlpD
LQFKKKFAGWLIKHYQLVIRDEENLSEKSTFSFSYAKLIFLGIFLLSTLIMCSLALATTLLSKWLNPMYLEQENKKKLVQLATAVDALEEQVTQQKKFIALLQSIIAGKEPPDNELPTTHNEQPDNMPSPYTPEHRVAADAPLQNGLEYNEPAPATTYNKPMHALQALFFLAPVHDTATPPFKHHRGHHGMGVVVKERTPIKCIADGVVIFSAWTIETGWAMVIQHNKDLVSVYKHNAALLKKVGSLVATEEVIAMMGNPNALATGSHPCFELRHEGRAVNHEHCINF